MLGGLAISGAVAGALASGISWLGLAVEPLASLPAAADLGAWAMGLRSLSLDDPGVRFEVARPIPAWAWALCVLGALALAAFAYWRLQGRSAWRAALAVLRTMTIVLLLFLLTGPRLVRPNTTTESDWLVILVDRSESMQIPDAPGDRPGTFVTREQQLRRSLERARPTLDALSRERRILWLGFDAGVYDLPVDPGGDGAAPWPRLDDPTGRRTAVAASLEGALGLVASRPVAGVVVLSDGRSVDQIGEGFRERLKRADIFGVALGSAEARPDLAVGRVDAPSKAFINDTVPVSVEIERLGRADAPGSTVRIVDRATGLVLAEQRVEQGDLPAPGDPPLSVTLTIRPTAPGEATWDVVIDPDAPDLIAGNNARSLDIELVDRPLRVLYFDGYPRWDQRYIKSLLLREGSIVGTSIVLSPDRAYAQDGDEILATLPRTLDDWLPYDVVILGDFRADLLSRDQAESLREHVAKRGAGLLWIGGAGATPRTWASSPLADLLPVTLGAGQGGAEIPVWDESVTVWRTPLAARLGVLELGDPDPDGGPSPWPMAVSDPRSGWSLLRWAQYLSPERIKPTAEVLALAVPESAWRATGAAPLEAPDTRTLSDGAALVAAMRFGAGRSIYVATDEIWRWRYGRGESLNERFWIPLIRALGRERLARSGQSAMLEITPRQARVDQPIRLVVRLLDQALVDRGSESIVLRLRRIGPSGGSTPVGVVRLSPESRGVGAPTSFAATWLATDPGRYIVEADDALLSDLVGEILVSHPDDELRRLETDHALMASLSEPNAGRPLDPDDLDALAALPSRARTIEGEPEVETLWDKPAALALLLVLLVIEWAGRRLIKLS